MIDTNFTGNAAKTGYGGYFDISSSSTTADTLYAGYFTTSVTGNAARTNNRGIYSTAVSSSTTADTLYAADFLADHNGAISTGTKNVYGLRSLATTDTPTDSGGTINTYAGYFDATGATGGTSNVFGVYIADVSGGDDNIALCFDCDGTYSATTVASGIQFGLDSTNTQNLRIFRSSGAAAAQITIEDEAGTDLFNADTTTLQLNLSGADQPERLCHGGADASRALVSIGDCAVSGADFAEYFGSDGTLEPGEVVALDGEATGIENLEYGLLTKTFVKKSTSSYDQTLVGVVSTNPFSEVLGDRTFTPDEHRVPVALSGQAPVKVSTENGPVLPGDPLTSSSTPGVGMRATEPGRVIGMALSSYENPDPTVVGTIIVFVNPSFYFGDLTSEGSLADSQQITDNNQLTINNEQIAGINTQEPGVSAGLDQPLTRAETENLVRTLINEHEATASTGQQTTATSSASPTIDEFLIKVPEYLTSVQKVVLQTLEATLVNVNKLVAGVIESLPGKNLTVKLAADSATGQTGSLQVTDQNETAVVNIDAGGNLEASGSAIVNKLNLRKETTSVGTGTILSGASSIVINSTSVTTDSLIFVTATTTTDKTLAVTNKVAGNSFTVEIKTPAEADINFNWWIVN